MRTSLTETEQLEHYLLKKGAAEEGILLEAKLVLDPELCDKAKWQSHAYELVHLYGREKLLEEIKSVEQMLFEKPKYSAFQRRILSIFKR